MRKSHKAAFGCYLKNIRQQRGISLRKLEEATGIAFPYISLIESGGNGVGPAKAARLADGLKLEGEERHEFLLSADKTCTALGKRRTMTGCPPFLAELFAQRLEQLLGVEVSMIESFHSEHTRPLASTFPNMPRQVFVGRMKGAVPATLKRQVTQFLESDTTSATLAVIVHPDGRQSVIRCETQTF